MWLCGGIGIDMGSDTNCTVTSNSIHDNGSDGVSISGNTQNCCITGNSIFNNSGNGVNLGGNAAGNNTITGNAIQNNTLDGITIRSDDNVVTGNRINDNDTGVLIQNTATRTILSINNLTGNSTSYTDNGSASSILGNVV